MNEATLQTKTGEHVGKIFVPPFLVIPEVILWGQRVFIPYDAPNMIYREGLAWVVPIDAKFD